LSTGLGHCQVLHINDYMEAKNLALD
jgi:hypothetical protein